MKSEINLLPPAALKGRMRSLYLQRASRLYRTLVTCLLIVGLTYAGVWWVIWQSGLNNDAGRPDINTKPSKAAEQQVKEVNELLQGIKQRAIGQESWIVRLPDVLNAAPPDVTITTVALRNPPSADPNGSRTLLITGTASSRSSVVDYERGLRSLPWVARVEAPLQNLASGEAVTFSFTIYRQAASL